MNREAATKQGNQRTPELPVPVTRPRAQAPARKLQRMLPQYLSERAWHERILSERDPCRRLAIYEAAYIESARLSKRYSASCCARGFNTGYLALLRPWLSGGDVLEIGCGQGHALLSYAPVVKRIVGIEINPELVTFVRNRILESGLKNVEVYCQAAQALRFPPASFDVVITNDLWEHLHPEDAYEAARCALRVLRPNGCLIVATVNQRSGPHDVSKYWLPRGAKAAGNHLCEWGYTELATLLFELGYVELTSFLFAPIRTLGHCGLLQLVRHFPVPVRVKQLLEASPLMRSDLLSGILGLQNVLVLARKPLSKS